MFWYLLVYFLFQIIMSTYQLAVVLLFNEANSLTYQDITSLTHLQDKDLKRNVAALVDAKILIEHISNEVCYYFVVLGSAAVVFL